MHSYDIIEEVEFPHGSFTRIVMVLLCSVPLPQVVIWLVEGVTPLSQYTVRYQPDKKHFKDVPETKRFETPYRSPQGQLWELDETLWHLAKRLPDYAPRRRQRKQSEYVQPPLLEESQGT